jgi:hypothetical protein
MKSHILLLILLPLCLIALKDNDRYKNQYLIEPYNNELYTYEAGEVYQKFADEDTVNNDAICNNIIQELVYFGKNALDLYTSCDEKYIMLGSSHPLIQGDSPSCFLDLYRSYCNYEIQLHEDNPHANDLREFITSTLTGCIKVNC